MPKTVLSNNSAKPTINERADAAAQELARRYDVLNTQFTAAEERLKALRPIYDVWVYYNHSQEGYGSATYYEALGLHKAELKWRLVHAIGSDSDEEGFREIKPIIECSVEVRLQAAKQVRMLHEEIVKQKEALVSTVEEAINELTGYCAEI